MHPVEHCFLQNEIKYFLLTGTLYNELENVAIANALQLEPARHCAVPIRFNSSPVPSL